MNADRRYVERPPRLQPTLPHGTVDIPAPPAQDARQQGIIQQIALPLVTLGGFLLVSLVGQGQNNPLMQLLMVLPMGIAALVTTTLAWREWRRARREEAVARESYIVQLTDLRRQMELQQQQQQEFYQHNYPGPDALFQIIGQDGSVSLRLWERRSTDVDFGALRLGAGNRASTVRYQAPTATDESGDLYKEAQRLAGDSQTLHHAPILVRLFQQITDESEDGKRTQAPAETNADPAYHALGICGQAEQVYPAVYAMLAGFTLFHSPAEANLLLVATSSAANRWSWLRPLPHCPLPRRRDQRRVYPICIEERAGSAGREGVKAFWKHVRSELDQRERRLQDKDSRFDRLPFLLVIADLLQVQNPDGTLSALADVEGEAAVAKLMQMGDQLGAAILFLAPERNRLPSQCQAVLELARTSSGAEPVFRFAAVGNDAHRFRGQADTVNGVEAMSRLALGLGKLNVRLAYGQDVPAALDFMDMFGAQTLDELEMVRRWQRSTLPEAAEWMSGLVGMMSGGEVRQLTYSADRDGVHGMVAGSTGSGKSELLMTLILGLCVRYDPSIINFVLCDFKGGAAFEPFRNLPHCVDIVTNLEGAMVDRMFASIIAELNRRQEINRREDVKHIVQYRQKGYHLTRAPYPHLFIFIDEFAEMIAGKAEYKAQLDSITRLGRSLGVTLILAAQRPTGVTDQMRANIKFRICLRVETPEESSEMLRRREAAYLPPGVPGRGYLQVGNENIELIQVAYSGEDYLHNLRDEEMTPEAAAALNQDIVWLQRLGSKFEAPKLFEVMVQEMDRLAREGGVPVQKKPWPSPLPKAPDSLALGGPIPEIEYIPVADLAHTRPADATSAPCFEPIIAAWLDGDQPTWGALDWAKRAMQPVIGLVDDPANAAQRVLRLNFQRGHVAVFGTSASGKSTLLRTVALALAALHTPETLHLYLIDFGNRALDVLSGLPHTGAFITANEAERLQRLLNHLTEVVENRKQALASARANSLYSYNQNPSNRPLPAILVMIDNFAEFKDSFEDWLPQLTSLIRDGLPNGLHFIVTGEQSSALPAKLYALFTERLAFKLAEMGEYSNIVGRGVTAIIDTPGRGYLPFDARPLEFQALLPVKPTDAQRAAGSDETRALAELVERIGQGWAAHPSNEALMPPPIRVLPPLITLDSILQAADAGDDSFRVPLGIQDHNLQPAWVDLGQVMHCAVSGTQLSGKTNLLWSWILGLTYRYSPAQVGLVLVDSLGYLADYRGTRSLAALPHILSVVTEAGQMAALCAHLAYELEKLPAAETPPRQLFIFIDNLDDFNELKADTELFTRLTRSKPGRPLVHFIISGTPLGMRGGDDFLRRVNQSRFGLATNKDAVGESPHNTTLPRSLRDAELPLGRGFVIRSGKVETVQMALPWRLDDGLEAGMDQWVEQIITRWESEERATWLELPVTDEPVEGEASGEPTDSNEPDSALVAAARAALEPLVGVTLLAQLPSAEIVALAQSYDLLVGSEASHE